MSSKPTNPKDSVATATKVPLHLFPVTAIAAGCIRFLEGAVKYGRNNWRAEGARATVYIGAAKRHIDDYLEGYDLDADGECNLAGALASIAILIDARASKSLVDDRNFPGGYRDQIAVLTPKVAELIAKYEGRTPHHYTVQDAIK